MAKRNSSVKAELFLLSHTEKFSTSINPANIFIVYSEKAGLSAKLVFIFNFLMLYW